MKIRNFYLLLLVVFMAGAFNSCSSSDNEEELVGNWTTLGDFDGSARSNATSFVIGDYAYICMGYNPKDKALHDLWRYDKSNKTWVQQTELPADMKARYAAVSFTANGKAYVGLGLGTSGGSYEVYDDFWEYDPSADQWTQVVEKFKGGKRYYAVAATVNGVGIVGSGTDDANTLKDFYAFIPGATPGSGTWKELPSYEGSKRSGASCFVIGNDFYLVGGISNGTNPVDMQKFTLTNVANLESNSWTRVLDLKNTDKTTDDDKYNRIPRAFASTFVINGKGYLTLGDRGSALDASTFEYDPATNKWIEKTAFSRVTRTGAVAFSLSESAKTQGFILTGKSGSSTQFDDFFEFSPDDANNTYDD